MRSRHELVLDLMHGTGEAVLATQSLTLPGFPFATHLSFAPDAKHCPIFLISGLAEHTQNLLKDDRASLLLRKPGSGAEMARATLLGRVRPFEADELLVARYLRYQPEAERFLQMSDFRFFRMEPLRIRTIGGFAQAGWLDGSRLSTAPTLSLMDEAVWIDRFAHDLPPDHHLLGIDAFGIDLTQGASRTRRQFEPGPVIGEAVGAATARALARLE